MPPPSEAPPGADILAAEQSAAAEDEVNRLIKAEKAKQKAEAEKADIQSKVEIERNKLRPLAADARSRAEKLNAQATALGIAAGDLEGHIITAGDRAKHDPKQALQLLASARAAFEKVIKS